MRLSWVEVMDPRALAWGSVISTWGSPEVWGFPEWAGIRYCTKPPSGIKCDNHNYQRIKYLVLIYNHDYQKIKYLIVIYNHDFQIKKKKTHQYPPKIVGSLLVLSWNPTALWSFWNTQNLWFLESDFFFPPQIPEPGIFFVSENFQIPRTHSPLILKFFKYAKLTGITKIKYSPTLEISLALRTGRIPRPQSIQAKFRWAHKVFKQV